MGDVTASLNCSSSYAGLSSKYYGFYVPAFKVMVEGSDIAAGGAVISSVSIDNSVEKADSFSMVVEYGFNIYTSIEQLEESLDIGKKIQIQMGYTDKLETVFHGYITSLKIGIGEGTDLRVTLSGMDYSFKLMKGVKSRSFLKMKYSEIAQQLAGEGGLSAEVDDSQIKFDYVEQSGVTNYQFLSWMAERCGAEFFVGGNKMYFRKLPESGSSGLSLKLGSNLLGLDLEADLADQISSVIVTGWDPKKKESVLGKNETVSPVGSLSRSGKSILQNMSLKNEIMENYHSQVDSQDKADRLAKSKMQRASLRMISGTATCIGIPELRAGGYIKLEGLGSRFSSVYYIRSTTHTIDESGYITVIGLGGNAL